MRAILLLNSALTTLQVDYSDFPRTKSDIFRKRVVSDFRTVQMRLWIQSDDRSCAAL